MFLKDYFEKLKSKEIQIEEWTDEKVEAMVWLYKRNGASIDELLEIMGHAWPYENEHIGEMYESTDEKKAISIDELMRIFSISLLPEPVEDSLPEIESVELIVEEVKEEILEVEPVVDSLSKSDRPTIKIAGFQVLNSLELEELEVTDEPFLLEPFIPKTGLSVLASRPDVGKSQFCRQLALEIENGSTSFVGQKLNTSSKRVLMLCTEDSISGIKRAVDKQQAALGYKSTGSIYYAITNSDLKIEPILKSLESALSSHSFDLVVVDGYGDLFDGADMNSITDTRRFLQRFDVLARKCETSILFVHHMTKASYNGGGSMQEVQGSGGIIQKPRSVFTLTKTTKEERLLKILKGNTAPHEYKQKGLSIKFSEDSLTFTADKGLVDIVDAQQDSTTSLSKLYSIAEKIYAESNEETITSAELKKGVEKAANLGDSQAKVYRNNMIKYSVVLKDEEGKYFLNPIKEDEE